MNRRLVTWFVGAALGPSACIGTESRQVTAPTTRTAVGAIPSASLGSGPYQPDRHGPQPLGKHGIE